MRPWCAQKSECLRVNMRFCALMTRGVLLGKSKHPHLIYPSLLYWPSFFAHISAPNTNDDLTTVQLLYIYVIFPFSFTCIFRSLTDNTLLHCLQFPHAALTLCFISIPMQPFSPNTAPNTEPGVHVIQVLAIFAICLSIDIFRSYESRSNPL